PGRRPARRCDRRIHADGIARGRLHRPHRRRSRIPLDEHVRNWSTTMTTMQNISKRTSFAPAPDGLSFRGVLRSELIKITSLRSNVALLLAIIVFGAGVSAALALTMADAGVPEQPSVSFMLDQ